MAIFKDILVSIIDAMSKNQDCSIDEILISKAKEYGLNDEDIKAITETNSLIDSFLNKTNEIKDAKKKENSRKSFLHTKSRVSFFRTELERITKELNNDEKAEVFHAMPPFDSNRKIERLNKVIKLSEIADKVDYSVRVSETISLFFQYNYHDFMNKSEESENMEIDENIQQTLDSLISSNSSANLAKIIAATSKIAKSTGSLNLADDSIYKIASIGDEAALLIKTSYHVTNDEIDIEETAEILIDRAYARLIVLLEYYIEHKLPLVAEKICDITCKYNSLEEHLGSIIEDTVTYNKPVVKNLVREGISVLSQLWLHHNSKSSLTSAY